MKRLYILVVTLAIVSCRHLPDFSSDKIVAQVGDVTLRQSDVQKLVQNGLVGDDSAQFVESYIHSWAMRQLKIRNAERVLGDDKRAQIEQQIADYRATLFTRELDSYYIEHNADTTVTEDDIAKYYTDHRSEFPLDRTIVRGVALRVPTSYRQIQKLKELIGSPLESRRQDLRAIAEKNGFELREMAMWIDLSNFTTNIPAFGEPATGSVKEVADGNYRWLLLFEKVLHAGDTAPQERVSDIIRRAIYNQRSNDAIRSIEEALYNASLQNGELKIKI